MGALADAETIGIVGVQPVGQGAGGRASVVDSGPVHADWALRHAAAVGCQGEECDAADHRAVIDALAVD